MIQQKKHILNQESQLNNHGKSMWQDVWRRFMKHHLALYSAVVLVFMLLLIILGPFFSPYVVDFIDWENMSIAPDFSQAHYFGTDAMGRDLFVRTLHGGRTSLMVGIIATLVSVIIGVAYGSISGYLGGKIDEVMMRIVDVLYALPFMFLVIMLMVVFGQHLLIMFAAIGGYMWLDMARIVRGQTLSLKNKAFIEAAVAAGANTTRILIKHILPNLMGVIVIYVTLTIPQVILVESFLSFLGLGVQEPYTSWGVLVNEGALDMEIAAWSLLFPASFLAVTLMCFNFIGDGLRDALDPKSD